MEAHESDFLFLGITQDFYEVPFFQRGYVWQEDNWNDLWNDLIDDNILSNLLRHKIYH